jgi:hypothetical protein
VYEVTFTLPETGKVNIAYIGIGSGEPSANHNQEPLEALQLLVFTPQTSFGEVRLIFHPSAPPLSLLGHITESGPYRVRIEKVGEAITYSLDEGYDGTFEADMQHTVPDISLVAPFLNDTNSHLFFGTAIEENHFDDVAIYAPKVPPLLINDSDPEGDPLTTHLAMAPAHGMVTLGADGQFLYTPDPGFAGMDHFTYTVFDGTQHSEPATVVIAIRRPGDTDGDGDVDLEDFSRVKENFGIGNSLAQGDLDGDRDVDLDDFDIVKENFGSSPAPAGMAAILAAKEARLHGEAYQDEIRLFLAVDAVLVSLVSDLESDLAMIGLELN